MLEPDRVQGEVAVNRPDCEFMTKSSFDFHLAGYEPIEELARDLKTVVYRAICTDEKLERESRSVAIEVLVSAYPTERELADFRYKYAIAKNLDCDGIVRPYHLEEYERGYALVMEDFGGISLVKHCQNQCLSPIETIEIAIQLTDILQVLGQQRIVHQDIKPANMLIHPITKQVKLIDLSIAAVLTGETPALTSPNLVAGTLAYLAPEQTGRIDRGIDYRTDFYGLGVTLYELLTGKLPFVVEWDGRSARESANELIYCHLAQTAIPIDRVNPAVPPVLAHIVAKLMSKNAEDRYQSAVGLKYDLTRCAIAWQATGTIAAFELGQRDLGDRFSIPDRLYGREQAVQTLLATVERVSQGHTEMMLVAGGAGIGKTAVINAVYQPMTRQQGWFIAGKFDQFNLNVPLSAFVRAFRDLIDQLLSQSDPQLASWRSQILTAVGENGQVLIAAIPELELIIGPQPPIAQLAGMAAQQRFNWVFQKFIEIFATAAHPLTICLDDLHWVDPASLQLMQLLMDGKGYLLLLGAYRDNEVSATHPLMSLVAELRQSAKIVRTLTIAPLEFDDLNRWVADTLHCAIDRAQPLTALIASKTQGNPFFITQFLKALAEDGEIRFNPEGYWECDIVRVRTLAITDDVVAFMVAQLQKLPPQTQQVLKLAACIGDRFDLDTLAIVSQQSKVSVVTDLWQGVQAGLILPSSQIYQFLPPAPLQAIDLDRTPHPVIPTARATYRFLHDRVQQAAYALIPESAKQQTHLQIGRLLLADPQAQSQAERLFEIVNHLNTAIALLIEPAEREELAALNLRAAQTARTATAYVAAYGYARIGTEVLGEAGWTQHYSLALSLHETLAEAAFLSGDFAIVPALVQSVLARARMPIDRVKAYETIIHFHAIQKQYPQAIARGLEILHQLGIKLAPRPDRVRLLQELVKTKIALWGKSTAWLLALPEISDPAKIAKLRILDLLQAPAFFCSQELMMVLSFVGIRLTLRDGNTRWAAGFYATYCIVISGLGELQQTYRLGELATILAERFADLAISARIKVVAAWYAQPWQKPLRTTIPLLDESIQMAIDSGNLQYIGINAGVSLATRFYAGIPLHELVDRMPAIEAAIYRSKDENSHQFFALMCQTILKLHVPSDRPTAIVGTSEEDELSSIAQWQACNEAIILSTLYSFQTLLAYHFEDLPNALIYADNQLPYEYAAKGGYSIARIWLFDALTRLAVYAQSDRQVQPKLLQRVDDLHYQLGKRARLMPANFQHQYDLVAAERCRVLADMTSAIDLYDRAIAGAKTHRYLQEEALANELAAKFYLGWGKERVAATYMQEAYYVYARWGAKAKTEDLARRYPQLLIPVLQARQTEVDTLSALTTITTAGSELRAHDRAATSDLVVAIQSAQALSSTLELEELIHQLSQIVLKHTGAQTCILALPDRDEQWQIRSRSIVCGESIATTQLQQPLIDSIEYPTNSISWIRNTRQPIAGDARQRLVVPDRYLQAHQPQSIFGLPIVNQDRVLGVVYLEHRQVVDLFTDIKKTAISFLCTQAAIALENARLYQEAQASKANAQLQRSYLEALLNNIPHIAWLKDRDARFIAANQSFGELAGCLPSELVGKNDLDYWPIDLAQKYQADDFGVMASGERQIVEEQILNVRGEVRWLETIKTPIKSSEGEIAGTAGIAVDITDRKLMEVALRESEARYHQLVSNVPGALYQFEIGADGTHQLNYISARCTELFELAPSQVVADLACLLAQIVPADRQSFDRSIRKATKLGHTWVWEGRIRTPSGQLKWIRAESRQTPVTDGSIAWDGILLDVTTRKQAEIALRQSEARYQKLADNIPGIIYQFRLAPDGSMTYPYVSSGCWELLEVPPTALMLDVNCAIGLMHPDDCPELERAMIASARDLTPILCEARAILHSGELKWIKYASRPERQPDGAIVWDGVMLDVTAQKAAQQERHRQEAALKAIVEWTAIGINGLEFYQACTQYLAQSFDVRYAFLAEPSDRAVTKTQIVAFWAGTEFLAPYEMALADTPCGVTYQHDWAIFPQDLQAHFPKATILASLQAQSYLSVAIRDRDGKMLGNLGIIDTKPLQSDISAYQFMLQLFADRIAAEMKRQANEYELRQSQQQIQAFINNSPAAMYLKDLEGRYRLLNQTCVNLSGGDLERLLGQTDYAVHPPEIARQICANDRAILQAGETVTIEEVAIDRDGIERTYLSNKFVLTDDEGQPYALGGVSTDITDRKQVENALQQTNQRLESANTELLHATRLKDDFLATMSHELRTPLNAILGMSEALQEEIFGTLNPRQLNAIWTIEQSGQHLLSLIEDILDVSKISAGKLALNLSEVSIAELCRSSLILVRQQAIDKQIQIDTDLPVDFDWISVDERRMRQVLINLLNNAVKFTNKGGVVTLSVRSEPLAVDGNTGYCLCFAVRDTGIGIASTDLAKLFQPFIQLDSSLSRKYSGTGLGLVLVKQIVELHGGDVTIDSEVGSGSCFTVTLPQLRSPIGIDRPC